MDEISDKLQSVEDIETDSNVISSKDDVKIIETNSQHDLLQCTLDNNSSMTIENINNTLNNISKNGEIESKSSLNESTSNQLIEQKETDGNRNKDNNKIKISDLQVPMKKNIEQTIVINTFKNQIVPPTPRKNVPLDVEKIAIPKTETLDVELSPSTKSNQTKITPSIISVSPASVLKPIPAIAKLQPALNTTEINSNKIILKQEQGVKLSSPINSSKILLVPHNGVNYVIKNSKSTPTSNAECNELPEQKKQTLLTQLSEAKKVSKFVTRMQKLPDGKYKMLAPAGKVPAGLENLFNSNSHFIKQKVASNSTENEPKVSYFIQSSAVKSNSEETNCMEISSVSFNHEERNILDKSSEETKCIEISSINSTIKETNNITKESQVSPQKTKIIEMSSVSSNNEETNCIKSSPVDSIPEETNNVQKESQEIDNMETSSISCITDKMNCSEKAIKESDKIINSTEIMLNHSVTEKMNPDKKEFQRELQVLSEETNCMESSSVNSIIEESNIIEYESQISSEETSSMESSSVNPNTEENNIVENKSQVPFEETSSLESSSVNAFPDKTKFIQTKLNITSDKFKCMGASSVDPDVLVSINKETPVYENVVFKAPDISSFQRHKFIVSRSTANKRYAMKNIISTNNQIKINTIGNKELFASPHTIVRLIPKSQPTIQTNNQPLIISKYDSKIDPTTKLNPNFNKGKQVFVKIIKADSDSSRRVLPPEEIRKLFPRVIHASKIAKVGENYKKNIISPSEVIQKEKKIKVIREEDRKFIACKNKYCTSLTHGIVRPELIDNLYCSLACKMLDEKPIELVKKLDVQSEVDTQKKPVIDRKKLLEKLKSRINKRKQSLPSGRPEKIARHDNNNDSKKIEFPRAKPSINFQSVDKQSKLNSLYQIIPKPVQDKEDLTMDVQPKTRDIIQPKTRDLSQLKTRVLFQPNTTIDIQEINEITSKYLKENEFISAPKKLFDKPFPTEKNTFKVGHKLEGIDPTHEALFCVMTVVDVVGYRIKLHFDGYPGDYDFWVNADNPDLFYTNWCQENHRTLKSPRGYKKDFDWYEYLEENGGAIPAPKLNFASTKNLSNASKHLFCVGNKLEALDKMTRTLSKQLICVATIADILGKRIRIHFDGWSEDFDYWTDITSTNIHPIGWCDKNGRNLCPPNEYDGKKNFKWAEYLKETKSKPVPEEAFVRRPLREFTVNMAIEVVDLVVPSLIRVAKVVDVRGNELKILYDGFDNKYAYWIDDDSPDIHPIGWCLKTNHPLEIPSSELFCCKVAGCKGKGNANSLKPHHLNIKDCPYDFEKWSKIISGFPTLPDRLSLKELSIKHKRSQKNSYLDNKKKEIPKSNKIPPKKVPEYKRTITKTQKKKIMQTPKERIKQKQKELIQNKLKQMKGKKNLQKQQIENKSGERKKSILKSVLKVMNEIEYEAEKPKQDLYRPHFGIKGKIYPKYPILTLPPLPSPDASKWTIQEVGSFVDKLVSLNSSYATPDDEVKYAERFIKREIDGKKLLDISQDFMEKSMKIPLGSSLKIFNGVKILRREYPELVYKDESIRFN